MTLITIRITTFWGKFLFVAPAMAVALLVHEGIWTLFFPILFLSLLFSIEESRKKRQFAGLGLLSVASLVSALWLANSHLTRAQAQAIYESIQAKADVPLREDAFHVLHRSVEDNLSLMQNVWSNVSTYVELLNSLVVIFPVLLICIGLSVFILRQTKGHFVPLVIPASLSPLVMNCVGWDLHRWSMMSTISGFLTLYVVWARHGCPPENSNRIVPLLAFGIFLVSVSNTVLSDGHRTKDFPFVQHQRYLYDVIFGHGHFPHVPSQ